jgi:hypothetical protein
MKRIEQQKLKVFSQLKTSSVLNTRSSITIAATIICSALQKLHIDHCGTTKRVTAQWCSNLSGVSHGRIQSTLQIMDRIDIVIQI